MPWRGPPPGDFASQIDMAIRQARMKAKNAAVCQVQAIQEMSEVPSIARPSRA